MRGLWPSPMMNDNPKATKRCMGHRQGSGVENGKGGNASNLRGRRKPMAADKSKETKPSSSHPQTLGQLIRAIRSLGICRINKIGDNEWQIDSSKEGRVSCLLVSRASLPRRKPSCAKGGDSKLGRGKEKGQRGRGGTRPVRGANQGHNANKRSARSIYEVFGTDSITTGCSSGQPSDKGESIRPRVCQESYSRGSGSDFYSYSESGAGI